MWPARTRLGGIWVEALRASGRRETALLERALRNVLETADRAWLQGIARAVRKYASGPEDVQAIVDSEPYPLLDGLFEPMIAGVLAAWDRADRDIKRQLRRRGLRVLQFALTPAERKAADRAALDTLAELEDIVAPKDAIAQYIADRIPPLQETVSVVRRRVCAAVVSEGVSQGYDIRQLTRALEVEGFGNSRFHRENIARTESATLYSHGRIARSRASSLVVGWRFSAAMDDRVTDTCESLHGHYIAKGEENGITPPLHYECRSELIEVMIGDEPDEGFEHTADLLADPRITPPMQGFGGFDDTGLPPFRDPADVQQDLANSADPRIRELLDELRATSPTRSGR